MKGLAEEGEGGDGSSRSNSNGIEKRMNTGGTRERKKTSTTDFLFCAVAKKGSILMDFSLKKENCVRSARDVLTNLTYSEGTKSSYACGGKRTLRVLLDGRTAFACLAANDVRVEIAFNMLDELKSEFMSRVRTVELFHLSCLTVNSRRAASFRM